MPGIESRLNPVRNSARAVVARRRDRLAAAQRAGRQRLGARRHLVAAARARRRQPGAGGERGVGPRTDRGSQRRTRRTCIIAALRGGSSAGRASRSQCEGREFDPPPLHQYPAPNQPRLGVFVSGIRPCRRLPAFLRVPGPAPERCVGAPVGPQFALCSLEICANRIAVAHADRVIHQ